jgi:hypothetical protein
MPSGGSISRFLCLLFVSVAEWCPQSSQDSTNFVGSNWLRGGPTILMNNTADVVLVNSEDLNGIIMKFICEKTLSHWLEDIGIMSRWCINLNNLSTRNLSWESRSLGRRLNSGPSEYNALVSTTRPYKSIQQFLNCYMLYTDRRISMAKLIDEFLQVSCERFWELKLKTKVVTLHDTKALGGEEV